MEAQRYPRDWRPCGCEPGSPRSPAWEEAMSGLDAVAGCHLEGG